MRRFFLVITLVSGFILSAVSQNPGADGYKGIWFTLGQFSEYGDKYSGGLGTYTADQYQSQFIRRRHGRRSLHTAELQER